MSQASSIPQDDCSIIFYMRSLKRLLEPLGYQAAAEPSDLKSYHIHLFIFVVPSSWRKTLISDCSNAFCLIDQKLEVRTRRMHLYLWVIYNFVLFQFFRFIDLNFNCWTAYFILFKNCVRHGYYLIASSNYL